MTPHDLENPLPDVLRDSKLPWEPREPDQARCPRCGDCWTCPLGELRFELEVSWGPWDRGDGPSSELPVWRLRLVESHLDRERGSWELPSLETVAHVARSLHELLLEGLLRKIREARRAHAA